MVVPHSGGYPHAKFDGYLLLFKFGPHTKSGLTIPQCKRRHCDLGVAMNLTKTGSETRSPRGQMSERCQNKWVGNSGGEQSLVLDSTGAWPQWPPAHWACALYLFTMWQEPCLHKSRRQLAIISPVMFHIARQELFTFMMSHYIPPAQAPRIHFFQFSLSPMQHSWLWWSLTIHSLPWQTFGLSNPEKKGVVVWPCRGDGKKTTISSGSKSWRTQGHLNIWLDFVFSIWE